ncbi:twin-arginine translocase TatA/TatE family subunit [Nocardioides sp. YIM 152588]|uniref:twin-arginine translocase TatA/TatE family subunit n=1 Tax=Nocardioides sp. YIM 152588 TaxID=3158259 RepID=UPI0032E3E990
MLQNLSGWHALVILTIVLLVFGSAKLPTLAKSVGESMRILKDETRDGKAADTPTQTATQTATPTVTPTVPPTVTDAERPTS